MTESALELFIDTQAASPVATIAALPAANSGNRGLIRFVTSENEPYYSNGTTWSSIAQGAQGDPGPAGAGVPAGGEALQIVRKNSVGTTTEWVSLTKSLVGLPNVDNTSDANKPISSSTLTALNAKASVVELNAGLGTKSDRLKDESLTEGSTNYVFIRDKSDASASTFRYEDMAEHRGSIINLHHRGAGDGGYQAYGLNIANYPGAKAAFVIHQYSAVGSMIRLDNTDVGSAIQIWNTENQTMNPGGQGTGAFLDFKPFDQTQRLRLFDSLVWRNDTSKDVTFETSYAASYALGVRANKDIVGLFVHKNSTGLGAAVAITNEGTSPGIDLTQNGAALGIRVTMSATNAFGMQILSNTNGASVETSSDSSGSHTFQVMKRGTGTSRAMRIFNYGTGASLSFYDGALVETASVNASGEYENRVNGNGVILRSPNGGRYRVAVGDTGTLTATKL